MRVKFFVCFDAQIGSSGRYPPRFHCSCFGRCECRDDVNLAKRERTRKAMKASARDVADLILLSMQNLSNEVRYSLHHGRNVWITCSSDEFMRFLVARRDAGYVNNIRSLRIELLPDLDRGFAVPEEFAAPYGDTSRITDSPYIETKRAFGEWFRPGSPMRDQFEKQPDAMVYPHDLFNVHREPDRTIVQKRQFKKHIFFVLNGESYDRPEWLRTRPKADGWYVCQEGQPYVCSEPMRDRREAESYL